MSDNMTDDHTALHQRVRDGLLRTMQDEGLKPGDRVPTEARTSELFGVSRSTAREALRLLEQDGVVTVRQGKGRFLSASGALRVERPIDRFESVTEMLTGLGYQATSAVLSVEDVAASAPEAQALQLDPGGRVVRLVRLRYGDDRPLILTIDAIPRDHLPGPLRHRDWSGSVTEALTAHGHRVDSSVARLRAVTLPPHLASRHGLAGLGPWLLVEETCVDQLGRPVLFALDYHRGDDIAFHVVRRR
jgi:GntR family transcriptional regulator